MREFKAMWASELFYYIILSKCMTDADDFETEADRVRKDRAAAAAVVGGV